jgi:hypothetical protein
MAITDTTTPYEVLIRYGPDGKFQGAHVQTMRTVKDGDEVLAQTVGDAQSLGDESDPAFKAVLGQALADAISTHAGLTTDRDAQQARADGMVNDLAEAERARDLALSAQAAAEEAQAAAEAALATLQAWRVSVEAAWNGTGG